MKSPDQVPEKKPKENNSQPAIPAETYPAGMEGSRGEPEGGEDKPGPKNPEPLPPKA